MNIPPEVLVLIFSYFRLGEMIEVSALVIRKNKFFISKLKNLENYLRTKELYLTVIMTSVYPFLMN